MRSIRRAASVASQRRALQFEALEPRQMLATYFVDVAGNDVLGNGTISQPFATINRAVNFTQPGDTVSIRAGVYREQVEITRSGTANSPITFEAYNGEEVLITTTDPLTGWTQHSGAIYRTTFDASVRGRNNMTLFVDGELMDEAHWSDLGNKVDRLDSDRWASMSSGNLTTITDTALRNMPADRWNGGFVWAQTTDFTLEARRIVDFSSNSSSGTLTVDRPFDRDPRSGDRYLIFSDLDALDAPGEWYFDVNTDTLYLWAPGGVDPDTLNVEAKGSRNDAFDLNGHDYIHIRGIDFRGGDLEMAGSSHILLEGARIQMPDYGFGPEGSGGAQSLFVDGSYNTIRDNEFDGVHATAIRIDGAHNRIYNNYFHEIGYNNVNGSAINLRANSVDTLFSHNTIERVGRAAIGGPAGLRSVIQYNDFSQIGLSSSDTGAIYLLNGSLGNGVIHHNVFHDIDGKLNGGVYLDNNASDIAIHNNISYDIPAYGGKTNLPNSFVLYFNNTHYNSGSISSFLPSASNPAATGSKFFNNIISSFHPDLTNLPVPPEFGNNVFTASGSNFENPGAGDFRLRPDSAAVDAGREIAGVTDGFTGAAPDAGALELGQTMWRYGHDFANPPRPLYQWSPAPFSNRVTNPGFDAGLEPWVTTAGTPTRYNGNSFNYRGDALATVGTGSLELKPGDQIEQTITGLLPNMTYEVFASARLVKDLQFEERSGQSGAFTTGNHRSEDYISDVDAGEWVRFDSVNFGAGSPRYNRIEIGTELNNSLDIELRLGSPTGSLIGTLDVPSRGEPWFMTRGNISAVTGVHDLYVVFKNDAGGGRFDRIRLLNTNEAERVTLGVKEFSGGSGSQTISIGGAYWNPNPPRLTFATGPSDTSATLFLAKQGGTLNGYVDGVALTGEAYQTPQAETLEVVIDPQSGGALLRNNTADAVSFGSYAIRDTESSLDPDNWLSLTQQEYRSGDWVQIINTANTLSELMPAGMTTLSSGDQVYLGRVVDPSLALDLSFEYRLSSSGPLTQGAVRFEDLNLPELTGDYNGDLSVDAIDYAIWRESLGASGAPFSGADGNGSGTVDRSDLLLWRAGYGQRIVEQSLIDAATNNGSFENLTGGQGAPEQTNANRVANSLDTPNVTDTATATIPGWTSVVDRYLDGSSGNVFAGFDSNANRASDGLRYAFVNKRSRATLTSDPITEHITQAGDEYTLTFDTGSADNSNAEYIVRLRFGSRVREIDAFTEAADGGGGVAAYTRDRTYSYTATAADAGAPPVVEFVINAGQNADNGQWLVDNVRLEVRTTTSSAPAAATSQTATLSSAALTSHAQPTDVETARIKDEESIHDQSLQAAFAVYQAEPTGTPTPQALAESLARQSEEVADQLIDSRPTYDWSALPESIEADLADEEPAISEELAWTNRILSSALRNPFTD